MHVALFYSIYPPIQAGGAELIVSYLAEGLVARGHRVTVISTCGPEMEPYPPEVRNGVEVLRFFPPNRYWLFDRAGRGGLDKARWHLRDAWNLPAGRRLRVLLRTNRPDVAHCHGVEGFSPIIWRAAKSLGLPVIHTAHDYYIICPRALLLTRKLKVCSHPQFACRARAAWYLQHARSVDLFCSPSRFLLDRHLAAGLDVSQAAVVWNGIPDSVDATPRVASNPDAPLKLLFLGRLTPEKGLRVALEALRRIKGASIELTIAGKGALEEEARAAADADPRIRFVGYVSGSQKEREFANADCLVVPSLWYENGPLVTLEAAAHGLAVIASRLGAIPEFVEEGSNGLLFEAGDSGALARAIARLASDRALLGRLRTGGKSLAAKHSVDAMVDNYLARYRELVSSATAGASDAQRAG